MISEKMQDALNDQTAFEFHSAHIYLGMSAYLEAIDLPGMANWMRIQYQEETTHAEKIFDHVIERDGRAKLTAWEAPPVEWKSALDAFEHAYTHEQIVTRRIDFDEVTLIWIQFTDMYQQSRAGSCGRATSDLHAAAVNDTQLRR